MGTHLFLEEVRKLKGARWRHRGRTPWAVDCVGLIAVAGAKSGLLAADVHGYGREPWDDQLRAGCRERWGEPVEDWQPGDIALIRWANGEPSHLAVLADHPEGGLSVVHAHNVDGVVECRLSQKLRACVVEVYRPRFA